MIRFAARLRYYIQRQKGQPGLSPQLFESSIKLKRDDTMITEAGQAEQVGGALELSGTLGEVGGSMRAAPARICARRRVILLSVCLVLAGTLCVSAIAQSIPNNFPLPDASGW